MSAWWVCPKRLHQEYRNVGPQDRVGAVEPGEFADLVTVFGNPLADIIELEPSSSRDERPQSH